MCGSLVWTLSEHFVSGVITGSQLSPNRVPKWSELGSRAEIGIGYISQSVLKVKNEIHWDPLISISGKSLNTVQHGLITVCLKSWHTSCQNTVLIKIWASFVWTHSEHCLYGVKTRSVRSPNSDWTWSKHGFQAVLGIACIGQSVVKKKIWSAKFHWDPY